MVYVWSFIFTVFGLVCLVFAYLEYCFTKDDKDDKNSYGKDWKPWGLD